MRLILVIMREKINFLPNGPRGGVTLAAPRQDSKVWGPGDLSFNKIRGSLSQMCTVVSPTVPYTQTPRV